MNFYKDPTFWAILGSNAYSIFMAVTQNWSFQEVLLSYWLQSVIIGLINAYRIATLKEFSVEAFMINGKLATESPATKRFTTIFFLIHYGFFHLVYLMFILKSANLGAIASGSVTLSAVVFAASHLYSYRRNNQADFKDKKPNIGTLMFYPYLRIIPMHLIIIMGDLFSGTHAMILFMVLKTIADAAMHNVERRLFKNA